MAKDELHKKKDFEQAGLLSYYLYQVQIKVKY
jgi:hypothetical protein